MTQILKDNEKANIFKIYTIVYIVYPICIEIIYIQINTYKIKCTVVFIILRISWKNVTRMRDITKDI